MAPLSFYLLQASLARAEGTGAPMKCFAFEVFRLIFSEFYIILYIFYIHWLQMLRFTPHSRQVITLHKLLQMLCHSRPVFMLHRFSKCSTSLCIFVQSSCYISHSKCSASLCILAQLSYDISASRSHPVRILIQSSCYVTCSKCSALLRILTQLSCFMLHVVIQCSCDIVLELHKKTLTSNDF